MAFIWIIAGILYVLYKYGEDAGGDRASGITIAAIPVVAFIYIGIVFAIINAFGLAESWGMLAIVTPIIIVVICANRNNKKPEANDAVIKAEMQEIDAIFATLQQPTVNQMELFFYFIRHIDHFTSAPSTEQLGLRGRLIRAENGQIVFPVDAKDFMEMQAAWLYYSRHDSKSCRREYLFGHQCLEKMKVFALDVPRDGEPVYIRNVSNFCDKVQGLPVKISSDWCNFPGFIQPVFDMIESGTELTLENIYPLMNKYRTFVPLDSYERSIKSEIISQLIQVELYLRENPTMIQTSALSVQDPKTKLRSTISRLPLPAKERNAWLGIRSFRELISQTSQDNLIPNKEELLLRMTVIYNDLLTPFAQEQNSTHDLDLLYKGLSRFGKSLGMEPDTKHYPKFIIANKGDDYHDIIRI